MNSSIYQEEYNVEFQTTNQEGEDKIEMFDLNKIFQFSYNFDILKNLVEALIKNQQSIQKQLKSKQAKILDLEAQFLDLKILLDSGNFQTKEKEVKPQSKKSQQTLSFDTNPKLFSVLKGNSDILRSPPNDIKLEVSIGHDDIINQIIVS